MILVHGRGASAADIMTVGHELMHPGLCVPGAAGGGERVVSEPVHGTRSRATSRISPRRLRCSSDGSDEVIDHVPHERVILLGFSQGACLTLEFAARHAQRYGGVVGFSGGLIGPDGTPRDYPGIVRTARRSSSAAATSIRTSPKQRVVEAGDVLKRMGADVTVRLYPNMAHTVNADEIHSAAQIVEAVAHEVA